MPVLQSIQQVPSLTKKIANHPIVPYLAVSAMILIEAICFTVNPIFGLSATAVLSIGSVIYLQNRRTTRLIGASLTIMVLAVTISALFPAGGVILLATAAGINGLCLAYAFYKIVRKEYSQDIRLT